MSKVISRVAGLLLVSLAALSFLAAPMSVLADSPVPAPDSDHYIIAYSAYENTYVAGDTLIILLYNIPYTSIPVAPASSNFIFRYLNPSSTVLQSVVPYVYASFGYNYGAAVFYWGPSDSGPIWGEAGSLQIIGNPTVDWAVSPPPSDSEPMLPSNWQSSSNVSQGRTQVDSFITTTLTTSLADSWSTALTTQATSGTVLTSAGQTYFSGIFSQASPLSLFNTICSSILVSTQAQPVNPPPPATYAPSYQEGLMQVWLNSILGPDIQASANSVGINTDLWLFGTFAIISMFALGFITVKLENPGFAPLIFIPIFVGGIKIGVVPMDLGVGVCAILFILSMYLLIHRRAAV